MSAILLFLICSWLGAVTGFLIFRVVAENSTSQIYLVFQTIGIFINMFILSAAAMGGVGVIAFSSSLVLYQVATLVMEASHNKTD